MQCRRINADRRGDPDGRAERPPLPAGVHRGYVLDQGRNAYTGTGRELLADPNVIELYLGTLAKATRRLSRDPEWKSPGLTPGLAPCSGFVGWDQVPASKFSPSALPMLPSVP